MLVFMQEPEGEYFENWDSTTVDELETLENIDRNLQMISNAYEYIGPLPIK
jgi:hypothetical protein